MDDCGYLAVILHRGGGWLYPPEGEYPARCEGGVLWAEVGKHGTHEAIDDCPKCARAAGDGD